MSPPPSATTTASASALRDRRHADAAGNDRAALLQIGPTLNYLYPQPMPSPVGEHNYDRLLAALGRRDGTGVRAAIDRAIDEGNEILLTNMPNQPKPDTRPRLVGLP